MREIQKRLESSHRVTMPFGVWEVGTDLPEGEYDILNSDDKKNSYFSMYIYDKKGMLLVIFLPMMK